MGARVLALGAIVLLGALASAPSALAHAQLLGSSPVSGATVANEPREVVFHFNQPVGGTLGAVRVYDAAGAQVDDLAVSHPGGDQRSLGVGLRPGLPDGTYTATYRVISADTHIVYGGLVFSIGHPGAPPRLSVAGLISRNRSGRVTAIAFAVVRALDYATIALLVGGLGFLLIAWLPALAGSEGEGAGWAAARAAFARRLEALLILAVGAGLLVSVLGVLLQGASAAGLSLWGSLKGAVIDTTLESRFGEVWGARALDWLALALLLALARRRAHGGASRRPPALLLAGIAIGACYLVITPALSGHASVQSPTGVFFASDALHVLAASVWVGGIACLALALPAATRRLEPPERSRLLLATLSRFSPLALAAVLAIAVTGVLQAYIEVRTVSALTGSTYGQLIIAKSVLLIALIGLGWLNRTRVIPSLARLAGAGEPPGPSGVIARRSIRAELAGMACVLGVTAALVSYAPPIDAASGPFSASTTLGAAVLEMTVEPARVGLNTIHLYLIDARTGVQFTATRELTARALLPARHIGPLSLALTPAGPGHYILPSAVLSPGGTWQIQLTDRVSEFQQSTTTINVPIR